MTTREGPRLTIWIDGAPVDVDTVLGVATSLRDAGALPVYSTSDAAEAEGVPWPWDAQPDTVHPSAAGYDAVARALLQHERSLLLGVLFQRTVVADLPCWIDLDLRHDSLVSASPLDERWRRR